MLYLTEINLVPFLKMYNQLLNRFKRCQALILGLFFPKYLYSLNLPRTNHMNKNLTVFILTNPSILLPEKFLANLL